MRPKQLWAPAPSRNLPRHWGHVPAGPATARATVARVPQRQTYTAIPANLEPPPAGPPFDPAVKAVRVADAEANERNWLRLGPAVAAHLDGYTAAVSELELAHRTVANETTLDLTAPDRPAALWLVSGRCIGHAKAVLELLRLGYTTEVVPVLRSLHEANRTLSALARDDEILEVWTRDRKHVNWNRILASIDRWEQEARQAMLREGVQPPRPTKSYMKQLYGWFSEFMHHRRQHLVDQVSVSGRLMPLGSHPDARVRATFVGLHRFS